MRGQFRKFCAFEGPFDEFIYIDCDTVVLKDVYFTFQFLDRYAFVFSHSDLPQLRQWVWKDSIFAAQVLTEEQIVFAANTGFFASKAGHLSIREAETKLAEGLILVEHMELLCAEQPYLNYLIVTSGKPFTSLLRLQQSAPWCNMSLELWAGHKLPLRRRDRFRWILDRGATGL